MTTEEAIKKMKECSVFEFDYNADIDEWLDCLEVAINALEKQVPKKPEVRDTTKIMPVINYKTFSTDYVTPDKYACPVCGTALGNNPYLFIHCYRCGQAILWEDE